MATDGLTVEEQGLFEEAIQGASLQERSPPPSDSHQSQCTFISRNGRVAFGLPCVSRWSSVCIIHVCTLGLTKVVVHGGDLVHFAGGWLSECRTEIVNTMAGLLVAAKREVLRDWTSSGIA